MYRRIAQTGGSGSSLLLGGSQLQLLVRGTARTSLPARGAFVANGNSARPLTQHAAAGIEQHGPRNGGGPISFPWSTSASSPAGKYFDRAALEEFQSRGYIKASADFLTAQEKRDTIGWVSEMRDWPQEKGKWMKYYELDGAGSRLLCRIENFLPYHEQARGLIRGKITEAIGELFGEPGVLYKEKINFKLPGSKGFPPHQDGPAYATFGIHYHVTCFIAADDATMENGCLEFIPRDPAMQFLPHDGNGGGINDAVVKEWDEGKQWVPLECRPGEAVFFDSLIPHRSRDNLTRDKSRSIYYLTFNRLRDGDRRDDYYLDKRSEYPPEIEREAGRDYSEGGKTHNMATPYL